MKKVLRILVAFSLLSFGNLALANHHFDKQESLHVIQGEIDKSEKMNLLTIHVQLEKIGAELEKKWDAELFAATLKFYPPLFKQMDHYATVEAIAPFYEQNKKEIDQLVKKSLEKKDQEEFYRRLQLALKVRSEGNG